MIVPKKIKKAYSQVAASPPEVRKNFAGDSKSSPVWFVPTVPPAPPTPPLGDGKVGLGTIWVHIMIIPVADQYGDPLDALYQGVSVAEFLGNNWVNINQPLTANGTYKDPVGVYSIKDPLDYIADAGSPEEANWLAAPIPAMPLTPLDPQNIRVSIAGHEIEPITTRQVIPSKVSGVERVRIKWQ